MKYLVWVPCFVLHHHSFKYESLLLKWVRFVELYAGKCNYHNIVSEFTTAMETVCDLSFFLAKPRLCVFIIGFCLYNWSDFLRDGDCKVLVKRCRILLLLVSIFFLLNFSGIGGDAQDQHSAHPFSNESHCYRMFFPSPLLQVEEREG